jgi:hypothetical protein
MKDDKTGKMLEIKTRDARVACDAMRAAIDGLFSKTIDLNTAKKAQKDAARLNTLVSKLVRARLNRAPPAEIAALGEQIQPLVESLEAFTRWASSQTASKASDREQEE